MREVPMDDGFGLSDVDLPDLDSGASDAGSDLGFDFLQEIEEPGGVAVGRPATAPGRRSPEGMTQEDVAEFRARWADVQASFIDDPQRACEQADNLVDLVLTRLTERFARERDGLVRRWDRGNEATDTEDLRLAMKGYRGLIDRLLTAEL